MAAQADDAAEAALSFALPLGSASTTIDRQLEQEPAHSKDDATEATMEVGRPLDAASTRNLFSRILFLSSNEKRSCIV